MRMRLCIFVVANAGDVTYVHCVWALIAQHTCTKCARQMVVKIDVGAGNELKNKLWNRNVNIQSQTHIMHSLRTVAATSKRIRL